MKFKVGDRVRCVESDLCDLRVGARYTISRVGEQIGRMAFVQVREVAGVDYFDRRFERIKRIVAPEHRSDVRPGPNWGVR